MSAFDDVYHQTDSFLSSIRRSDLETRPILDQGKTSQAYIADAASQHRNAYVGMPTGREKPRKHKRKSKSHKKHHKRKYIEEEPEDLVAPQQKVQFILGTENHMHDVIDGNFKSNKCSMPRLFTEMDELETSNDGPLWKETARWIKFEECVEEGGDRWSKPHVSSLSLHSLFELRSCILHGVVQLDMESNSLEHIADIVLDKMVSQGTFPHDEELRDRVKLTLLSAHKHKVKKSKTLSAIRSVADLMSTTKHSSHHQLPGELSHSESVAASMSRNKSGMLTSNGTETDLEKKDKKLPYFMKKIPPGAEASNVLVGQVDFLEKPFVAFLRMQNSVKLDLSEVPIPTRFLFVLLGPVATHKRQYQEIGRSIATLLADEVFHDVAYKAKTRQDLLAGIDEFLDQVTVLPPGEWDASIRIEPPKDLKDNQMERLELNRFDTHEKIAEHSDCPELQRSGRLFGGLINDIKRKSKWYWSDYKDALSLQCVASFIFLYFAVLTPIVTFGGLLGDATHNNLAAMESIFGGALAGCCFHLFSGQPLTIIGSTGPILVFEEIMFDFCETVGLEYISLRWWVGLWTGLICIILVATDASSLIQYITRFTEESFSALISLIFIYNAFKKLIHIGDHHAIWHGWDPGYITEYDCQCIAPNLTNYVYNESVELNYHEISHASRDDYLVNHTKSGTLYRTGEVSYVCSYNGHNENITDINDMVWANRSSAECTGTYCGKLDGESCPYTPDAMLMSVILFFLTFVIAHALKGMKTSRFFPTAVRSIVSDFSVTIAIALMVVFDMLMDLDTPKLIVPDTFRPTRSDRQWYIDPMGKNPWYSPIIAIIPALLATILIFMDQQITAVIVNRKENKLKKGCGYHLDLLIVALMLILCSMLGLPWFVAATVLSITHVNSLKMESQTSAPGESAKFLGVREQRVTGILIFLLIGLSVFMTPILRYIPMPVLYGVFLYMGISSLKGVQFIDRLQLYFMPPKHQPDLIYLRHVPLTKVYLFTFIQLMGLVALWVVALVGIRKLFDFGLFSQHDLMWLDDIMPESTKKKKEDAKKKKEAEVHRAAEMIVSGKGVMNVPLEHGGVINKPLSKYDPKEPTSIDISKEMSRSSVWKNIETHKLGSNGDGKRRSAKKHVHEEEENGIVFTPPKIEEPTSKDVEMFTVRITSDTSHNEDSSSLEATDI